MNVRFKEGFEALTEKEKQTLRLIVRGHDAKSTARSLGLSVHTINERLRDARRKMAVSSSREAARLLLEAECEAPLSSAPQFLGHTEIGEEASGPMLDQGDAPIGGARRAYRRPWIITGVVLMTLALSLVALATLPQLASAPVTMSAAVSATAPNAEIIDAARNWLTLQDQSRWDESYRATGATFRQLNTVAIWRATSEQVRTPLGAVVSRTLVSVENLPAPPSGYQVVKFRTRFVNKAEALETVTLNREDGGWRVVGVLIE